MKLNPVTCAFEVTLDKFLGFIVSSRRVEANPEKIRAIQEMDPSKNIKEVQHLTDRVAVLNWFVSRPAECYLLFFQTLKQLKNFRWIEDCRCVFSEL